MSLTPQQIASFRTQAGLSATPPPQATSSASTVLNSRREALGLNTPPTAPVASSVFGHPLDALSKQYEGAIQTAKEGVTSGADTMTGGGVGDYIHGAAQAGFGAASAGVGATFAPFSASADALVPGDGFVSDVAKGGIVGAELGTIIPGAGTIAGGIIGGLFGGGMHVVNTVKDSIFAHTNISDPDKAMINNAINVGLAVLGEKIGEKATNSDGLNTSVSEVPGAIKTNLSDAGGTVSDVAKGTVSAVKSGANKVKEYVSPTPTIDQLVGIVAQGRTGDIPSFKSGIDALDTSKVSTYKDLNKVSNDTIKSLSKEQDALLGKDKRVLKVQQLATKVGSSYHNYVNDAVAQLKEYYTKTNDVANLKKIQAYEAKLDPIKGEGISLKDVNDIARMHGSDLNGYNANGELASGLTRQAAENTRMGLKDTVRNLLPDDESKALDTKISDIYTVKDLSSKMAESVNKLTQRIQKPNILRKIGGLLGTATRVTGIGDFASKLLGIDKVPGSQTLNGVEIEARLAQNLSKIKAALAKDDAGFIEDIRGMSQSNASVPDTFSAMNPMAANPSTSNMMDMGSTVASPAEKVNIQYTTNINRLSSQIQKAFPSLPGMAADQFAENAITLVKEGGRTPKQAIDYINTQANNVPKQKP